MAWQSPAAHATCGVSRLRLHVGRQLLGLQTLLAVRDISLPGTLMPFPFVPRSLYDEMQRTLRFALDDKNRELASVHARLQDLTEKYHALRLAGASAPVEPKVGRVVQPGPSPEALAGQRMHEEIVENLAKDIERMPGVDPTIARAEAQRLRDAALGKGTVV